MAIAVVGLVLTIFGLYLAFNSRREKRPLYLTNSYEVISKERKVEGLEVTLSGISVPSLTVTRVAFWNAGRETIDRADLVASDPLRIEGTGGAEILGAKLSYMHRPVTDVQIETRTGSVLITLDFLDFQDGCIVDIYHVSPAAFRVLGTLKGSPYPADSKIENRYKADQAADWFFNMIPQSLRNLPPIVTTVIVFPFYFPFRLATLPFGLIEMLVRPLSHSRTGLPDKYELK